MSAAELDPEQLLAGFLAGAVLPLTYRQILRDFVLGLDGAERELLGRVLLGCADRNRENPEDESYLNEIAGDTRLAFLDRCAPGLKFSIDLAAPTRAIMEGVRAAVQAAKKQSPQQETRRRPDRLLEYLEVWDLREGWDNGTYDGSREKTLKQISKLLKRPMETVKSQYRSAFQAITGLPFSPKVWFRLLGVLKLSATFNEGFGQRSWNRVRLLINEPADVVAENEPHQFNSDEGIFELEESIRMLLKQGHTDNEIVERLALKNDKLVSYYRSRADDEL